MKSVVLMLVILVGSLALTQSASSPASSGCRASTGSGCGRSPGPSAPVPVPLGRRPSPPHSLVGVEVPRRTVHFLEHGDEITIFSPVCEDLAQIDRLMLTKEADSSGRGLTLIMEFLRCG